jgi:hypothetical protein
MGQSFEFSGPASLIIALNLKEQRIQIIPFASARKIDSSETAANGKNFGVSTRLAHDVNMGSFDRK